MAAEDDARIDSALVASWYADWGAELHRFLRGVLGDNTLADDVLQNVFVKAVASGHTVREENCKAWLFRVAYHEAMAARRRQGAERRLLQRATWNGHPPGEQLDPLARQESVSTVRDALQSLPEEQRRIVKMRIYEEKTFAAIAAELDLPLGTVLGRMRSARQRLAQKLQAEHGPERPRSAPSPKE